MAEVVTYDGLSNDDICRYSRHLLVPDIGVEGQAGIRSTSVLIVGVGGLGAPVALYLAAAGIGKLGLVDYDDIELSNLQRQIIHKESGEGTSKADSGKRAVNELNSGVDVEVYNTLLTSENALGIISEYDVVADCTDNVATRYLINDACVLAGKPLVSGSALRMEGQLTVYNYEEGPCYRCLFPSPPPPEAVGNCSNNGVLGVVPGIIGSLQALEVLKIAAGLGASLSAKLLLFDATRCLFRTAKLRGRRAECVVCGDNPTVTELIDYEGFCGSSANDKTEPLSLLAESQHVTVQELQEKLAADGGEGALLLDVRSDLQHAICHLSTAHSLHIPLAKLAERVDEVRAAAADRTVYCMCRRGNDSQRATQVLVGAGFAEDKVFNVRGGIQQWGRAIDPAVPLY